MAEPASALARQATRGVPALIAEAGDAAARYFLEFFSVNIRNKNTRAAYARAAADFLRWCEVFTWRNASDAAVHFALDICNMPAPLFTGLPCTLQNLPVLRRKFLPADMMPDYGGLRIFPGKRWARPAGSNF